MQFTNEKEDMQMIGSYCLALCFATGAVQLQDAMKAKGYSLQGGGVFQKELGKVRSKVKFASIFSGALQELGDGRLYFKMIRVGVADSDSYIEIPSDILNALGKANIYVEASSYDRSKAFSDLSPEEVKLLSEAHMVTKRCVFLARGTKIQGLYGNIMGADRVQEGSGFEALECDCRCWVNTEYEFWDEKNQEEVEEAICDLSEKLMMNEGERKVLQIVTEKKGAVIRMSPAWLKRLGSSGVDLCIR